MGEKLPPPAVNSWLTALWQAAQSINPQLAWQDVYSASGMPFVYVAAESWCDPATIHCHPRMSIVPVPALRALRQFDVAHWAAFGIAVSQHWFTTTHELSEFLRQPVNGAVVIWGVDGPEYGLMIANTATTVTIQRCDGSLHTRAITALYLRSGIDIVVLAPQPIVRLPAYAPLAHACALIDHKQIVRFGTPNHPLRAEQAWHVGRGAFEVMALTADHAAPLGMVSTHVAKIMQDLWQRCGVARQLVAHWADVHPLPTGRQLLFQAADAFADAQFFLDIVCTHFPIVTPHRALNHAEGALIAVACRDVRAVLDVAAQDMRQALQQWQPHADARRRGVRWWAERDSNL
ncbi:MAG: hypothetical protein EBS29_00615 [Chloroflexia bacterium]|nr:hypothetical protein [Chloroflexia bacterium]